MVRHLLVVSYEGIGNHLFREALVWAGWLFWTCWVWQCMIQTPGQQFSKYSELLTICIWLVPSISLHSIHTSQVWPTPPGTSWRCRWSTPTGPGSSRRWKDFSLMFTPRKSYQEGARESFDSVYKSCLVTIWFCYFRVFREYDSWTREPSADSWESPRELISELVNRAVNHVVTFSPGEM